MAIARNCAHFLNFRGGFELHKNTLQKIQIGYLLFCYNFGPLGGLDPPTSLVPLDEGRRVAVVVAGELQLEFGAHRHVVEAAHPRGPHCNTRTKTRIIAFASSG